MAMSALFPRQGYWKNTKEQKQSSQNVLSIQLQNGNYILWEVMKRTDKITFQIPLQNMILKNDGSVSKMVVVV